MFETYLNVRGQEDLMEKVKKVWASAYTARAIAFRANKGFPVLGDELGVAIPEDGQCQGLGDHLHGGSGDRG